MPYVTKTECKHNRDNQNPLEEFIKVCPICGKRFVPKRGEQDIYCSNECYCSNKIFTKIEKMCWVENPKAVVLQ
jgi:NAD-dependent DNA ligase